MKYCILHIRNTGVCSRVLTFLALAAALLVLAAPLRAQLVPDGGTATLSNVTTNITGTVTVGTNGAFTLLVLSDNALLTNSVHGVISANTPARSNEVRLASPSASWLMGGTLFVGSNGAFSTLVVSNGALVRANAGIIGSRAAGGSNVALVTGAGSLWSNVAGVTGVGLTVGGSSSGNQLIVSNGGSVVNALGSGTIGGNSSNNLARVTGPGSVWSNRFGLNINPIGAGNNNNGLVIEDGGQVFNEDGLINGLNGSSNNFAFITGSGAVWNNRDLYLGSSVRAGLTLSNGGAVLCANGFVGSGGSQMLVTGGGSRWSLQNDLALVGQNNTLVVTNGGSVVNSNGYVGGRTPANLSASNNTVVVTGAGSSWSNRADLFVGFAGPGNRLVVSDGGRVGNHNAVIGNLSSGNQALVTGAGTRWLLSSNLYLGSNGPFNRLLVADGGRAVVNRDTYVGGTFSSSNNTILVTGSGSVLSNGQGASFLLGYSSVGNQLIVSNGALASLSFLSLSEDNISSSNDVIVTGPGSTLNPGLFVVGQVGRGNRLLVSQSGSVNSGSATVGMNTGSRNNDVLVTGAGSSWKSDLLTIGFNSQGNRLVITNGGELRSGAFARFVNELGTFVGENESSTNNRIVVDGGTFAATNPTRRVVLDIRRGTNVLNAGLMDLDQLRMTNAQGVFEFNGGTLITREAVINNTRPFAVGGPGGRTAVWDVRASTNNHVVAGDVLVGNNTSFHQLLVTNGGVLRDNFGILGVNNTSHSNLALVAGSGSVWSNANDLYVGRSGSRNELTVSNGGLVRNTDGYLGVNPGSSNNLVVVTDPGSAWRNAGVLFLGQDGLGNRVAVANGGIVHSTSALVGAFSGSSNNQAFVAGSGSVWSNALDLSIGFLGSGNQLVASNGALVSADVGFIGLRPNANRNMAIVTGIGTQWLLSSNLCVGSNGSFNAFLLNNGGFALNNEGIIGAGTPSVGNMALISGAGTVWSNRQRIIVGQLGNGNRLEISDGARVESDSGQLGVISTANSNEVVVTGPGSSWRMPQGLTIGGLGNRNRLVITNGGSVRCSGGIISSATSTNNEVIVTGAGSSWINAASTMFIGQVGSHCRLAISDGGVVSQQSSFGLIFGSQSTSTNNRIEVDNGTLAVTNSGGFAPFDLRRGRTILNAGLISVDNFRMTNTQGVLDLNGGTFSARNSLVSNGTLFRIGDGTNLATFRLAGNGVHVFAGILAAIVSSNATLTGNGMILGSAPLQFRPGSLLAPGTSVGTIIFSNSPSPSLQGTVVMEISKTGAIRTNDQIQATVLLTYGGSLVVSNIGPGALAAGDHFQLFSADTFAGGFTNITLPALPPELGWTNRLLVDGSIEVIVAPQPGFANIAVSGTNVVISATNGVPNSPYALLTATNVALPLSNWVSLFTNQFGAGGEFSITNGIAPGEAQRYFRIRTP